MTLAATVILASAALYNYPGGEAFRNLHQIIQDTGAQPSKKMNIHIDNAAAISGVSRFGEIGNDPNFLGDRAGSVTWVYSKEEDLDELDDFRKFHYLITEDPEHESKKNHEIVG